MDKIITVPFGWLLAQLYNFTDNYGVAMIIFAVLVKLILAPITAKSKKSSMKMSRLTPRVKDIQERYAHDQQKQSEMLQNLYKEEGVDMTGGCLWSLIPMFIIFPLLTVVREPIVYILGESAEAAAQIVEIIKNANPALFEGGNTYYQQVVAAANIPAHADAILAAIPEINPATLEGMNFTFLGVDLGAIPSYNIFAESWAWDWAHIGAFIIPCLSAGSQLLSTFIMRKMNNSLVTDKNGVQDKKTAEESQANQSMQMMLWMMPLMSLWIGFSCPGALSIYWLIQGLVAIALDVYLTLKYRKIYDEEDAIRLQRHMEEQALEAEKERIRAERRAANPEGQTQNTSKKKMQKKQQQEEEAAKAAAAREYAAKRGIVVEEEEDTASKALSGIPDRPWCKGRAYDPNRYNSTEE